MSFQSFCCCELFCINLNACFYDSHNMDQTETFMHESTEFFVNENLERFVRGEELLNFVDKAAGY